MIIKMLKWRNILVATALVLLSVAFLQAQTITEKSDSFIVQGASHATMIEEVEQVGGTVIHSFKVIKAISALLTPSQVATLNNTNPMLRMFIDSKVNLEGHSETLDASKPLKFKIKKNNVNWHVKNNSKNDYAIEQVEITWPEDNGALVDLKVNDVNIIEDVVNDSTSHTHLSQTINVAKGNKIALKMAFEKISSVNDEDYSVVISFTDGTSVSLINKAMPKQGKKRDTFYPTIVRANEAHKQGITGAGVTVAVIDSGSAHKKQLINDSQDNKRLFHTFDATNDENPNQAADDNGHGTHITSIIANNTSTYSLSGEKTESYNGIAPDANLVVVKAFDKYGSGSYSDILQAIEYVVENREELNIKVLNLSFSAIPKTYYWEDPVNQALMVAWKMGITVVAAAGNQGPDAMTIGVPGNNPYVITVGALSENYSPSDASDDFITSFSSAGPSYEGFVKPELVAPGGHIQGLLKKDSYIGETYPLYNDGNGYFTLSGTSQSTAITSGIVALMLQNNPNLSPDDIKCRLMYSAKVAVTDAGDLAYSVFQQGSGLVDAMSAIEEQAINCANVGMDIELEIAGEEHYVGPARRYENDGDFYVEGTEGFAWNGLYNDSLLWGNTQFISNSLLWGHTQFSSDSLLWGNTQFTNDSLLWGNTQFISESLLWGHTQSLFWGHTESLLWGNTQSLLWGNTQSLLWGNTQSLLWGNTQFIDESVLLGFYYFDSESLLWGHTQYDVESLLWGHTQFTSESLLWGHTQFIMLDWVDQE